MNHAVINIRTTYARVSPDPDEQERYEAECERARAEQKTRGHRYAIAPRQSLSLHDGTRLGPGQEVRLSQFRLFRDVAAWQQLEALVHRGLVLEADIPRDEEEPFGVRQFEERMRRSAEDPDPEAA
jgi:hypothetical protein